jgi:hypothetical protein
VWYDRTTSSNSVPADPYVPNDDHGRTIVSPPDRPLGRWWASSEDDEDRAARVPLLLPLLPPRRWLRLLELLPLELLLGAAGGLSTSMLTAGIVTESALPFRSTRENKIFYLQVTFFPQKFSLHFPPLTNLAGKGKEPPKDERTTLRLVRPDGHRGRV